MIDLLGNNLFNLGLIRLIGTIPLLLVFEGIARSYWHKRNTINGLRETRLVLLVLLFVLIFDNVLFSLFNIKFALFGGEHTNVPLTYLDRISVASAFFLLYYFFKYAIRERK